MGRQNDNPWAVKPHAFPRDGTMADQLRFLLNYAVLAPSGHNQQPWRFVLSDDAVDVVADWKRALPALDPDGRALVMSCGAAVFHLRVAAHHFGLAPVVSAWPHGVDDDCVARFSVKPGREGTLEEHRLFTAIKKRRTHRGAFDDAPVPDAEVERLVDAANVEGATLVPLSESDKRRRLARLVADADERLAHMADVRREWVRVSTTQHDAEGIPAEARGWGVLRSFAAPLWMRLPGGSPNQAGAELERVDDAPLLVVLTTPGDTRSDWLEAGQALDRVLLKAATYGLYASFLNQPLTFDALRDDVADLVGGAGVPQVVLRLGYDAGFDASPTPRRSADDVVVDT